MERLILFARAPAPHRVKTRLSPPLSATEALSLYEAMLEDQIRFVAALAGPGRAVEVCSDHPWDHRLPGTLQGEGDLGVRMARALARAFDEGADRAAIVGADAPTLPAAIVEEAFGRLAEGAQVVIAPALDGGYVLVGATAPTPPIFDGVPWGTGEVALATRRLARDAKVALQETRAWGDVDTIADLRRIEREIADAPGRAEATGAALRRLRLYFADERML